MDAETFPLFVRCLGAASGLILAWSIKPITSKHRLLLSAISGFIIAVGAAPVTEAALVKYLTMKASLDTLFVASALNGILIIPGAFAGLKYLNKKAEKGGE